MNGSKLEKNPSFKSVPFMRRSRKSGSGGSRSKVVFLVINLFYREERGSIPVFLIKPIPSKQSGSP